MEQAISSARKYNEQYSPVSGNIEDFINLPDIKKKKKKRRIIHGSISIKDFKIHEQSLAASDILTKDIAKLKRNRSTKDISYRCDTLKRAHKSPVAANELLTELGYGFPEPTLPRDIKALVSPVHSPLRTLDNNFDKTPRICGPPPGRQDAEILTKWLRDMLENIKKDENTDMDQIFEHARLIYTICFDEVVRQVSIHCKQRGELIKTVWKAYLGLLETALGLSKAQNKQQQAHFNKAKLNMHTTYLDRIKKLTGKLKNSQDENEKLNMQLDKEKNKYDSQEDHINRLGDRILTVQRQYAELKKQFLHQQEVNRILTVRINNTDDNSFYEEDETGQLVKKHRLKKKAKVRTFEEIENDLDFDPIINKDTMISNISSKQLKALIIQAKEEEKLRLDMEDYVDVGIDTHDLYRTVQKEQQTYLQDQPCQ